MLASIGQCLGGSGLTTLSLTLCWSASANDRKDAAKGQLRHVGRTPECFNPHMPACGTDGRRGFFCCDAGIEVNGVTTTRRKNGVTMFRIGFLILIVALAVFFFTNPSHDAHKQVVYTTAATQAMQSEVLGKIAVDLLGKTEVVPLTYNNYYLCSTTTLNGKVKSVGVVSHVWKWE